MSLDVGKELTAALQKALADYLVFSGNEAPVDAKEFSVYQGACKASLLHVALLVKLTQKEAAVETTIPDLSLLLEQAKKELNTNDFSGISVDLG